MVSDVMAPGARAEPDLPTGAWKLEESGGTDMVEGRPRQTKAYNPGVDNSEHQPCKKVKLFVEL